MKVLHVASEAYPLIKTGGLADVAYALPAAQCSAGLSVRLLVPGYPKVLNGLEKATVVSELGSVFGAARVRLIKGKMPGIDLDVYAIDAPSLYNRDGNPYIGYDGKDWPDNHIRYALLGWVAAHIAAGEVDRRWVPDIVHSHDWHAGLTPAYMYSIPGMQARSVFTIHNLAYRGLFSYREINEIGLPNCIRDSNGPEFFGQFSFLKAGITFANKVTTVSPTYASEILQPEYGFGLHGVLQSRGWDFSGILNGLDYDVWNPATDTEIAAQYDVDSIEKKFECKKALCEEFEIDDVNAPLFGVVSRLADQKGLDLVLGALHELVSRGAKFVLLGSGDKGLEAGFNEAANYFRGSVSVYMGYNETLSHHIVAGADTLMVPSRFEPCGLTQMMALRYGTLPLVRSTGGLADTVEQISNGWGDGFLFGDATVDGLVGAIDYACHIYGHQDEWQEAMKRAMRKDLSWHTSAGRYIDLYNSL